MVASGRPILLDLFAGTCIVGSTAEKLGWASVSMGILNGFDLTDRDIADAIIAAINAGQVAAMMLASPCNRSPARGGNQARTKYWQVSNTGWPRALRSLSSP